MLCQLFRQDLNFIISHMTFAGKATVRHDAFELSLFLKREFDTSMAEQRDEIVQQLVDL